MKKLLNYVLSVFTVAMVLTAGAGAVMAAGITFGNSSENILNGGVLATDGKGRVYFANTEKGSALYVGTEKSSKKLSSDAAANINVQGGYIYYTAKKGSGSAVYRITTGGKSRKELFKTSSVIEEMYTDSEGTIYYLTGGKVFQRESGAKKSTVVAKSGISHFIPTAHGIITVKGSRGSYTIYAAGKKIRGGVTGFYTIEDYLIFNIGTKDYQVKIRDLFDGFRSSDISSYNLGSDVDSLSALAEAFADDDCEECDENAAHVHSVVASDENISAVRATSGVTSALATASIGQKNMVKRARQQHEIKWTPVANITGWGGNYVFKAGTTYTGLPYGQPVKAAYVPWKASLVEFVNAVKDGGSLMYTSKSTYNKVAPYYSCDCSSFVSWSWDLPSRQYTRSIQAYCEKVESQSIYSCQVGDAFVKAGSHTVMVSDVGYRGDEIVYIDIMEQTPPSTKKTRWGEGGSKTLSQLYSKYLGGGYILYRSKTRDDVNYKASSAVPLDGESVSGTSDAAYQSGTVTLNTARVELYPGATSALSATSTISGTPSWSSSNKNVATVSSSGVVTGVNAGSATITVQVGSISTRATVYVHPANVTITSVKASKDGGITIKWSKVSGATSYEVLRKSADGTWQVIGSATGTSYKDAGTAANSSYTYTARALALLDGTTYYGNYDTTGVTGRSVLATPVLKSVVSKTMTSQKITWEKVEGAEGYTVYQKTAGTKWKELGSTKKTYYTAKKLKAGTAYTYTVRAYFKVGKDAVLSGYNETGVTAKAAPPAPVLEDVDAYSDHIELTWKKVSGAKSYTVYRRTGSGKWKKLRTVSKTVCCDYKVKYKTKYTYTVTANVSGVNSDYDAKGLTCKMVPGKPELKSVVSEESGKIKLTWKKVTGADGYYVYAKDASGKWVKTDKIVGSKNTSYTQKGLTSGQTATYTVRAYWKVKKGEKLSSYNKTGVQTAVK